MADETAWDMEVPGDRERDTLLGSDADPLVSRQRSPLRRWWPVWLVTASTGLLSAVVLFNLLKPESTIETALSEARVALMEGRLDDATSHLRAARGYLSGSESNGTEQGRYHALAAATLRAQLDPVGAWSTSNAEKILDHLQAARETALDMTPADLETLGLAQAYMGKGAAAQQTLFQMEQMTDHPDDPLDERMLQVRRVLARQVQQEGKRSVPERIELLKALRDDPKATISDMAWAAGCIARIQLDTGKPADAAIGLHRDIRRLEAREGSPSPELLVLLGRANRDLGRLDAAIRPLEAGLELAGNPDPIRGEAMVLLGDVHGRQGDHEEALIWYNRSIQEYPAAPSMLPAIVGRGRAADLLYASEQSMLDFTEAARRMARGDRHIDVTVSTLESILQDRFESALTRHETLHALALARLAASLRPVGERSVRVSTALAVAAGQVAADRTAVLEAQDHWDEDEWQAILDLHAEAGHAHLQAANAAGIDEEAWAHALFHAGVHLDAAGQQREAAGVFLDYVNARGERDPVRIEAMYRLAQALEADMQWSKASEWYDRLLTDHPTSLQATRCYVPSARCLLAIGDPVEARCRLESVVDGQTPLTPEAVDYRTSLMMLGRLCVDAGEYTAAVSHLQEVADRWPDHVDTTAVLFDMANARRALALSIDQRLTGEHLTPSQRQALESDRLANLWEAELVYGQVIESLSQIDPPTPNTHRVLRAATVARADSLLETARLQEAVASYESVARTWPDHPAAMHALVQVASAWTKLGDPERADAAHRRALDRLGSISDDVLDEESSFMSRDVWERWLATMPVGSDLYAGASSDP